MPSPLRKKKPPSASPQRRSILATAAASFAVAATGRVPVVHGNDLSPTSTIANVYEVIPSSAKNKIHPRRVVKIGHIPRTEFTKFPREDHHFQARTKYSESQIKKDLLSKRYWLLHHFNTPLNDSTEDDSDNRPILRSDTQEMRIGSSIWTAIR